VLICGGGRGQITSRRRSYVIFINFFFFFFLTRLFSVTTLSILAYRLVPLRRLGKKIVTLSMHQKKKKQKNQIGTEFFSLVFVVV
jgi:hypothetical protein